MRPRAPRTATVGFVIAALAAGYVLGLGGGSDPVYDFSGSGASGEAPVAKPSHLQQGPRGKRGPRGYRGPQGPRGPRGPEGQPGGDAIADFSLNWRYGAWNGRDTGQMTLTGMGVLAATCRPVDGNENGQRVLELTPARSGIRTVLNTTTFQASEARNVRTVSEGDTMTLELPVNGMITGVVSVEPISDSDDALPTPWTFTVSSEAKVNGVGGADSSENFCYVAAQAARGQ